MQQSHLNDTKVNKTQNIEIILEQAQRDIFNRYGSISENFKTFESRSKESG